jgi:hypothetical protein
MMHALSAGVSFQIGDQPSGRVTRVPEELILAISCGVNMEKNVSATGGPFRSGVVTPVTSPRW